MSKQDKPVEVVVDRGRVWIKRGVQSFMLDYEGEIDDELNWYAQRLREALSPPPAPPAPELPALPELPPHKHSRNSGTFDALFTANQMRDYARAAIAADRAARVPKPATQPDDTSVICPECCAQFRAIPVQVQGLLLAAGYEPPFTQEPVKWESVFRAGHDAARVPVLTDEQIDAIDADFVLHHFAPRGKDSVRAFARAVLAAATQGSKP